MEMYDDPTNELTPASVFHPSSWNFLLVPLAIAFLFILSFRTPPGPIKTSASFSSLRWAGSLCLRHLRQLHSRPLVTEEAGPIALCNGPSRDNPSKTICEYYFRVGRYLRLLSDSRGNFCMN
jgi:hypothetical protein